jgi:penicillin-binding protein 2
MHDPGFFTLGNHTFRDDKPGGHGWVDMQASIVQSCDTYYYALARDMGVNGIHDFMKPLGFGQITGIDIEGESRGILPSTEWKRKAYRKPEQQKWYDGETISLGIGQGYNSFTILQLANAVSIIVNNGAAMKPHLVKAVEDSVSRQRTLTVPKESYRIPLKQADIDVIKKAMVAVTHSGTAARVFAGAAYESAGKTGTAQTYTLAKGEKYNHHAIDERKRDHSLYTAFAPADNPKIALALIVENAGFGAAVAAPIARKVMDYYLLGKWPEELQANAPPPAERERAGGKPPVDTPSVFTTGLTANVATATVMANAPVSAASGADASAAGASAALAGASGATVASGAGARGASESIAAQLDPAAIAPASAVATLDERMLQALGHSKPAAPAPVPVPAPAARPAPASAPAPAKPRVRPVSTTAPAPRNNASE